jgi:hypothetical protein
MLILTGYSIVRVTAPNPLGIAQKDLEFCHLMTEILGCVVYIVVP